MLGAIGLRRCKIALVATFLAVAICAVASAQEPLAPPERSYAIGEPTEHTTPIELSGPIRVAARPDNLGSTQTTSVFESPVGNAAPFDTLTERPLEVVHTNNPTWMRSGELGVSCESCLASASGFPELQCAKCTCRPSRPVTVRPGDEIWMVSTRHASCRSADDLCVHRFECGVGFVPALVEEYFTSVQPTERGLLDIDQQGHGESVFGQHDSTQSAIAQSAIAQSPIAQSPIVTMYVHGNRVDTQTAVDRGLHMYDCLASSADPSQKLVHVIWSWPSDIIPGMFLVDARQKAYKTHSQSYLLADFVSRHCQQSQISLIGFSYGGRIILGSQHLLGGGETFGRHLNAEQIQSVPRTRIAIWAPALPSSWITPTGLNSQAVMSVDRMLLYYNSRDPALRFYRKKLAESDTEALGFRGIASGSLGPAATWVDQYNAAGIVGAHHSWTRYTGSAEIIRRTVASALWHDVTR